MKRFIVTHTNDYYSGGPSLAGGFVGDFGSLVEALAALKAKGTGPCTSGDILDQRLRVIYPFVEGKECTQEKL